MAQERASLRLGDRVTVAVSPRERQYAVIPSLISLFATIPREVRVIVVQGDLPEDLRLSLEELRSLRAFELIAPEYPLYPQEARNLAIDASDTEFIVITDNDMEYEQGWLDALVGNAVAHDADMVAPIICIGPPRAATIHHAGGRILVGYHPNGLLGVKEVHQLANRNIAEVDLTSVGVDNETVEFHCFLVRASYCARIGPLDERLTTQEQIHYGLLARNLGAKVTFEAGSKVTYAAKRVFTPPDLQYLSFRWNDRQALDAMEAIQSMWGLHLEPEAKLEKWVRAHRIRAYGTFYERQFHALTLQQFVAGILKPLDAAALERAFALRKGKTLKFVDPIDSDKRAETVDSFRIKGKGADAGRTTGMAAA